MKKCPFDAPMVNGGNEICEFLDDDTWECHQEECPYFKEAKVTYECPNCKAEVTEDDLNPSFRYSTLLECPNCIKCVKPDNSAKISNRLNDIGG